MSFYNDASLVFLPSGGAGKDTKAYSIKPTNGDGDFTFSRGSNLTATRVDSNGLIEKGRENLLLQSNNFDTTWALIRTNISGGQSGYDGSTDAWLFQPTNVTPAISQSVSNSGVGTYSVYAKANSVNWIRLQLGGSPSPSVYFDLDPNTIGNRIGTQANNIDASIQDIGSGWFRCSVTFSSSVTSALIFPAKDDNVVGDINSTIYIQDAQLEQGLVATEYIESGATTGKAGILEDSPRFDYSGGASCPSLLLEPSRTNLITNSEYIDSSTDWQINSVTVEDNSITSPENQTNATKLTGSGGSAQRRIYQSFSQVSGQDFTTSIFAKEDTENILFLRLYNTTDNVYANASFNLSTGAIDSNDLGTAKIENYGNGWYRCILTGTPSTTTTTGGAYFNLTDDGNTTSTTSLYLWGAQVEQSSYATSYIPNHSGNGSVTREAEDIAITTLDQTYSTDITIFLEVERLVSTSDLNKEISVTINSTTSPNNRFTFYSTSNGRFRALIIDDSGNNDNLYSAVNTFEKGETIKVALKITSSGCTLFVDGSSVDTSSGIGRILGIDRISFFRDSIIKQYLMFPTALSDADCITLTTL